LTWKNDSDTDNVRYHLKTHMPIIELQDVHAMSGCLTLRNWSGCSVRMYGFESVRYISFSCIVIASYNTTVLSHHIHACCFYYMLAVSMIHLVNARDHSYFPVPRVNSPVDSRTFHHDVPMDLYGKMAGKGKGSEK